MDNQKTLCFVRELLSKEKVTHGLSSLDKLISLARTRAEGLNKRDSIYRKSYSSRVPVWQLPLKKRFDLIATSHLSRAMQVVTSVYSSLSVDGPLEQRDPAWSEVETQRFVCDLALLDMNDFMIPWVKETSAYCACRCFRQEETNIDSLSSILNSISALQVQSTFLLKAGILGPGDLSRVSRWLMAPRRSLGSAFGQRILRIGENVLYIKRACPPMLRHVVESELAKHEARIARPLVFGPQDREATETRDLIKAAIDDVVHLVFRNRSFEPEEQYPSSNAAFHNARRSGGALGELLGGVTSALPDIPDSCFLAASTLDFLGVDDRGQQHCFEVRKSAATDWAFSDWTQKLNASLHSRGNTLHGNSEQGISARPFPIPEPCKIRVITLGEAVEYQRLLSVQKFLWRCVSSFTTFEFTAKPISDWSTVLDPSLARELCSSGKSLLSGDFSAATDNLDPELSEYVWSSIGRIVWVEDEAGRVPLGLSSWAPLVRRGLTGHSVQYGDRVVPQTWGQLMGSPVSFPILNIVNAATTVVALREHDRSIGEPVRSSRFYLRDAHVRTNGDDLFFVCPDTAYPRWKSVVSSAGLKPSVGKNYLSKEFLVINSEIRSLFPAYGPRSATDVLPPVVWRYETFVNLPILYGLEAKGPNAGQSILPQLRWWDLEALALQLVDGLDNLDPRFAARLKAFERYHRSVLAHVPPGVDWHVPKELGGVGIPVYDGTHPPSEDACRRAAWLACLDPIKRVRNISPPSSKLVDFYGWIQKQATRREQVVRTRVVQRTDLLLPERLRNLKRNLGRAATANLVRTLFDAVQESSTIPSCAVSPPLEAIKSHYGDMEKLSEPVRAAIQWYHTHVKEGREYFEAVKGHTDTVEAQAAVLQGRYQWQVRKQLALARRSALSPMKSENMLLWQSNGEIEELHADACYSSPILL